MKSVRGKLNAKGSNNVNFIRKDITNKLNAGITCDVR
jgi:hypothetical protein